MNEFQLKINKKLLKVNFLADIIEAELTSIKPETTINDTKTMQKCVSLLGSCKRYRETFDSVNDEFALQTGEISDKVDEVIDEILK